MTLDVIMILLPSAVCAYIRRDFVCASPHVVRQRKYSTEVGMKLTELFLGFVLVPGTIATYS